MDILSVLGKGPFRSVWTITWALLYSVPEIALTQLPFNHTLTGIAGLPREADLRNQSCMVQVSGLKEAE